MRVSFIFLLLSRLEVLYLLQNMVFIPIFHQVRHTSYHYQLITIAFANYTALLYVIIVLFFKCFIVANLDMYVY